MIDYPTGQGVVPAPVPDDVEYLSSRVDDLRTVLEKILGIYSGIAKQRAMLIFHCNGGTTVTNVVQTLVRYHIDYIVFASVPLVAVNFLAGNGIKLAGIERAATNPAILPVSFDIEPGIDYQFVSATGGLIYAAGAPTDIWLVGTIGEGK